MDGGLGGAPKFKRKWGKQVMIAFDQLANAVAAGWADETISARAYRQRAKPRWKRAMRFIDAMFFWQRDHCRNAYLGEIKRAQQPPAYRKE